MHILSHVLASEFIVSVEGMLAWLRHYFWGVAFSSVKAECELLCGGWFVVVVFSGAVLVL